jgi:RNA polymerase sigma factor (sigma-70 family)
LALTLSMTSMTPSTCSEHELITAARRGDDRAFEELYARYRDRIGAFIRSRVGDYGRAEDVAQEVFISALRRLRASDRPIHFKPWIYEIAKNACIDEHRRTRRAREVSLEIDEEAGGPRPLLSLAPTPPAAVETKQRLDDLRGAFGGLSESHHQLLVLRELEGLSYEEIGVRTGMSRQMVESALFRARRKLTEEYNEIASGRRCQQVQGAIEDGRALSLRSFGLRERRQFARHLAHCQPCRMTAHLAGVDESLVKPGRIAAKIAAFLPFPLWRWPWGGARAARDAAVRTGSNPSTLHSLQSAAVLSESAGASALGGAAVAAAVLALAGAGVGLAPGASGHHRGALPRKTVHSTPVGPAPASRGPVATARFHAPAVTQPGGLKAALPASGRAHVSPLSHAVSPAADPAPEHRGATPPPPSSNAPVQLAQPPVGLPSVNAPSPPTVGAPAKSVTSTLGGSPAATVNGIDKVVGSTPLGGTSRSAPPAATGVANKAVSTAKATATSTASAADDTVRSVLKHTTGS